MNEKPTISVIITSFNDKDIIRPFFEATYTTLLKQSRYDWELIYVDDGSTDGSIEVLKKLVSQEKKTSLIELTRNFGQQKAFFAGMKQAKGDIVITMDGDFQYDPHCLLLLADKIIEGNDIVSGIRIGRKDSFFAKGTSFLGNYFVRRALRTYVKDFGAIKAFSRFLTNQIVTYENYCIMPYGMAYALTNRITDVVVQHLPRHSGHSKWNFSKRVHVYLDLFLAYSPYEMTTLLKLGTFMFGLGFTTLSILLYLYLAHNIFFFHTFTAITAMCLMPTGLITIFGSFLLSFLLRIYRQLLWKGQSHVIRAVLSNR